MWLTPKISWAANEYMSFDDFQRIVNNAEYLATALEDAGYTVEALASIDLSRGSATIPYVGAINALELNIQKLVHAISPSSQYHAVTWYAINDERYQRNPTYLDWIRWEQQLLGVQRSLALRTASIAYSNEFYSEEVTL